GPPSRFAKHASYRPARDRQSTSLCAEFKQVSVVPVRFGTPFAHMPSQRPNQTQCQVHARAAISPTARGKIMPGRDIMVIGASVGGVETLQRLVRSLPSDLPASVFIVQHVAAQSPGYLPSILQRAGKLPVHAPEDGAQIKRGLIYMAPPDRHMLLEDK